MTKVLVVDDNIANLKLAAVVLAKAGYEVLTAQDGEAGLMMVEEHKPDLVLMDVQMPGLDGLEATRRLKAKPATAGIPIVALTALAMKGDEERLRAAGYDDYLAKPFHYPELLAKVAAFLPPGAVPR